MAKETLQQKAARLAGGKVDDLKKPKGKHGGARPGAGGSKPRSIDRAIEKGYKAIVDKHIGESVKVEIVDAKGKKMIVSKPRLLQVLEKLYEIGMHKEGSADALNKWLDRALGKAVQPLVGKDEDGVDGPILIRLDI